MGDRGRIGGDALHRAVDRGTQPSLGVGRFGDNDHRHTASLFVLRACGEPGRQRVDRDDDRRHFLRVGHRRHIEAGAAQVDEHRVVARRAFVHHEQSAHARNGRRVSVRSR